MQVTGKKELTVGDMLTIKKRFPKWGKKEDELTEIEQFECNVLVISLMEKKTEDEIKKLSMSEFYGLIESYKGDGDEKKKQ